MALFSAPMCSYGQRRRMRHNANYVAYVQMPGCPLCSIGELPSTFDEFLAERSQFDSDHGVNCYAPTCCQSTTFVRPLFAFYCPLLFTEKNHNVAFRHRSDVYAARLMDLRNR